MSVSSFVYKNKGDRKKKSYFSFNFIRGAFDSYNPQVRKFQCHKGLCNHSNRKLGSEQECEVFAGEAGQPTQGSGG